MPKFKGVEPYGNIRQHSEAIKTPSEIIFSQLKALYEQKVLMARQGITGPLSEREYKTIALTTEDIEKAYKNGALSSAPSTFAHRFAGMAHACELAQVPFFNKSKKPK